MIFYWLILYLAIFFEVLATICMKLSHGFTKTIPSIFMIVFYLVSLVLMSFTIEKIDVGTAYAVWSGFGTAAIAIVGIFWFNELVSTVKFVSIALIIVGIVGLNLSGVTD